MSILQHIGAGVLETFLCSAPFLLVGLAMAGLVHVLLPTSLIQRWMGRPGLGGVTLAALVGVPLPVCSCGVVPLVVEMRRQGASRPSSLSFLVTTPESSVDSILFTWGLMGPVMAVARPLAAFFTAFLGGALAMTLPDDPAPATALEAPECCGRDGCAAAAEPPRSKWRAALRYGFGELLDDLAFWLVLGIVLAGVLAALVPADLAERGLGAGLLPMLLMLAVGVPLYMCASASTPIAAALLAKGVGPGAALVFLLAGPATNVATLVLLTRTFGRRFVAVYLAAVAAGAVLAGLALDALVLRYGWSVGAPPLAAVAPGLAVVEIASFAVLAVLLARSLARGAARQGWRELVEGVAGMFP